MRIATICSLSVFLLATSAQAADYHLSASGNDAGPGTLAQPWKTIEKINSTNFAAGDRILFRSGDTFSGRIFLDGGDLGTPTNPIVLGSYGPGRATIDGGTGIGFFAYNVAGIDIRDLVFVGSGAATNTGIGILFYAELPGGVKFDRINVDNVDVSGFGEGITIGSWNGLTGYRDVAVTNSLVHDNKKHGVATYAAPGVTNAHKNVYIGKVKAYNQTGIASLTDKNHARGSGIVLGGVDGGVIEDSEANNNGALNTAPEGPVGIWAYSANNILIQRNVSHDNRTAGGGGGGGGFGLIGGVTNSVLQYNRSYSNDGVGYQFSQYAGASPFADNIMRFNYGEDDGRKGAYKGGILVWGASGTATVTNSLIHDNYIVVNPTLAGSTLKAIHLAGSYSGITVRDNTFVTSGGMWLVQADNPTAEKVLFVCNDYYPSEGPFVIRWGSKAYSLLPEFMAGETGQELCAG